MASQALEVFTTDKKNEVERKSRKLKNNNGAKKTKKYSE